MNEVENNSDTSVLKELSDNDSFWERLKTFRFQSEKPINSPEPIISIDGNIISTNGNLTLIIGQAKAGKSGMLSALIGGTLAGYGDEIDTLGMTVKNNSDCKAIIHIDTEQADHNFFKAMKNVLLRTSREKEPDWFLSYCLRQLEIIERKKAVELLFKKAKKKFGGIHIAFIDGVADFVSSVNDEVECNGIVHYFLKLATQYDCVILLVLHFNPNSEKGRGHLGSQLERKCESIISVSKDKASEISTIEGKFLRNAGIIPNLQFSYDKEKGYHTFCGIKSKRDESDKRINDLKELAKIFFDDGNIKLVPKILREKICTAKEVGEDRANQIISALKKASVIDYSDESKKEFVFCKPDKVQQSNEIE